MPCRILTSVDVLLWPAGIELIVNRLAYVSQDVAGKSCLSAPAALVADLGSGHTERQTINKVIILDVWAGTYINNGGVVEVGYRKTRSYKWDMENMYFSFSSLLHESGCVFIPRHVFLAY
ncbi:hypothetical protein RRG08_016516 [Elysia crispata]|uniref:Uncharacterized protein n=1 Tax=Elysia crispata TaxID=231223 RepID=A0AAE1CUN4_9GAST|nr:hypothetical protein RRG08_016516 [Elysia crispata]